MNAPAPFPTTPLSIRALYQSYGPTVALHNIDLDVQAGDIVGLVGANGAGKSTLLQTALGIYQPYRGHASVFGEDAMALSDSAKSRLSYVPQHPDLFGWLSASDLLDLMATLYPKWDAQLAQTLARRWDLPLHQRIDELSGGQQQRLQIVRALSSQPELLLLDEPVSQLDPAGRRQFLREIVDSCVDRGATVIFSSHIISDLERCANRIVLLHQGRLLLDEELDTLKGRLFRVTLPRAVAGDWTPSPGFLAQRPRHKDQVAVLWLGAMQELRFALDAQGRSEQPVLLSVEELLVELGS